MNPAGDSPPNPNPCYRLTLHARHASPTYGALAGFSPRKTISPYALVMVACALALRAVACENSTLTLSCYGQVIHIINAHYGRLDNETCDSDIGVSDTQCVFSGTRDIVYNRFVVNAIFITSVNSVIGLKTKYVYVKP